MKFGLGFQVSSLDVANNFNWILVKITSQLFSFVNEDSYLANNKTNIILSTWSNQIKLIYHMSDSVSQI